MLIVFRSEAHRIRGRSYATSEPSQETSIELEIELTLERSSLVGDRSKDESAYRRDRRKRNRG